MRDLCHIRDERECGCAAGTCHQQPRAIAAPIIRPVWKDLAMFFGAATIITIATLLAVSEAEKQFAKIDRENQEQIVVKR